MLILETTGIWQDIITQIILIIVSGVITVAGAMITRWINLKVKDEKIRKVLLSGFNVVKDGVDYVYQTYVQNLKGTDLWDDEARNNANKQAIDYIVNNLSVDMKKHLENTGKDITEWAKEQIEIAIKASKDKNKTVIKNETKNK